jgi:hypothetical protein
MATTTDPTTGTTESELAAVEHGALAHLTAEAGRVEADLEAAAAAVDEAPAAEEPEQAPLRTAIAVALPTMSLAIMVGGVFTGVSGRVYAALSGLLGIALAYALRKQRRPFLTNLLAVAGLFGIGLFMLALSDPADLGHVRSLVSEAAKSGDVLRPPVGMLPGWQAIIGWLMGIVGFSATWIALVVRRPALGLLLPVPLAAVPAISVPDDQQVASGIVALVLFALGLGLLSSASTVTEDDEKPSAAYEVRRALRALPLIAVISVALYALAQTNILFPDPYIDPAQEPQRPRSIPLSEVEDRKLFDVESSITGPWRIGGLDVYDGKDWRLPPFADNQLDDVPRNGVVDPELSPGVRARFTIAGLGGAVLPGLPNIYGIQAEGPKLAYDSRNGNIRVAQGQIQAGLAYTVVAAALPKVEDLNAIPPGPPPKELEQFLEIPAPPPAVKTLLDQAPKTSLWATFDYLRSYVLDNVTAAGAGVPKSITPDRVQDMLTGAREGTPFEIVAAQALLARWAGVPSRIGYGFDGGKPVGTKLEVRPRNGANFVEVWFPGYKWLPVIGTPKQAKPTVGADASQQQYDPTVLPSDEVSVRLFMPIVVPPQSNVADQVKRGVLVTIPTVLLLALIYFTFPALRKTWVRARRRNAARAAGPRARMALAYAEWRDHAADFAFTHPTDTPLMFLDRFAEDDEHTEFAWLVTRSLWGDLQDDITPDLADAAEELSRSLRRRLAQSQPSTVRLVAAISRASLRDPYAPLTDLTRKNGSHDQRALQPA